MTSRFYVSLSFAALLALSACSDEKDSVLSQASESSSIINTDKSESTQPTPDVAAQESATQELAGQKAAQTQSPSDPEALYRKCASCHGKDGKSIAPGSAGNVQIASLNKAQVIELLQGFRAQKISRGGNSIIMYMQAKNLSDEDIEALATYIDAF